MADTTFNYGEILYRLDSEVAIIVFRKKDKSIRTLLGTRSLRVLEKMTRDSNYMCAKMNGRDSKLNTPKYNEDGSRIANKNIAAIDLIIEDVRCFNIDNVIEIKWLGMPQDTVQQGYCFQWYELFKSFYDKYDERTALENFEVRQQMGI